MKLIYSLWPAIVPGARTPSRAPGLTGSGRLAHLEPDRRLRRCLALRAAVDVGRGFGRGLGAGDGEHRLVQGRELAGGIRGGRVAGQRQRLAAAAAEVDLLQCAGAAGLRQPSRAPEALEGGALLP